MDVASFVDSVRADVAGWDRAGGLPSAIVPTMATGGFLAADLPRRYGGADLGQRDLGEICASLGGVCSALRSLVTVQGMVAAALLRWGTGAQRAAWLPTLASGGNIAGFAATEEGAGSDLGAMSTTVQGHGDDVVVRGRKLWVSLGRLATVFLVFGRQDGLPVAVLVESDRPGVVVEPIADPLGLRAAQLANIRFEDVRVPAANLVAPAGFGLSHVAATAVDHGRHTVAWGCVGLAAACLEQAVQHTARRVQGGVRLADHQLVRAVLGRAYVATSGARQLCAHAARLREQRSPSATAETVVAKYAGAAAAASVSQDAVQLLGAAGCGPDNPVNRFFRDAKIMQIIEGSREVGELDIGEFALRTAGPDRTL
ncbi:acyl-CoA dehydrogenase family protein [Plantactinospora sp. S1510]|uniref:Acyl-CoA dehydrogenase family protein n=1 Tax=Plantactinospora alkalitolerans TaxID=2789879 RepID=A0ABS0GMN3_9ACTN|nr:acyl-CoA dehydrogenase family protein [Plantactinospora alkalitolerans]MBF9127451.1 acyl-CoA dehydrogenase family protein [Plantactinospora alkalitolerans]